MKNSNITHGGWQYHGRIPNGLHGKQRDFVLSSQATDEELAGTFKVSPRTIRRLRKDVQPALTAKEKPMITSQIETITPAIAAAMLETNNENRKPSAQAVQQYADDMRQGRWKQNGAAIVFDEDNALIDGQHRLMAVVEAQASIEVFVVRGVERETRDTIDINKVRGAGDVLQMFHIPNGNNVAALARYIMSWESGNGKSLGYTGVIGKAAVIERGKSDLRLQFAIGVGSSCRHILRQASTSFCRYIIADSEQSTAFFQHLDDGAGLEHGNPILALRHWALRAGKKVAITQSIEATLRAWCAFRDGRQLTTIKLLGEFPKP
jgi:hypothetical protein